MYLDMCNIALILACSMTTIGKADASGGMKLAILLRAEGQ